MSHTPCRLRCLHYTAVCAVCDVCKWVCMGPLGGSFAYAKPSKRQSGHQLQDIACVQQCHYQKERGSPAGLPEEATGVLRGQKECGLACVVRTSRLIRSMATWNNWGVLLLWLWNVSSWLACFIPGPCMSFLLLITCSTGICSTSVVQLALLLAQL